MKIINYIPACMLAFTMLLAACSKEPAGTGPADEGDVAVELGGVITRSDGVNGANIYMTAFVSGGSPLTYFINRQISFAGGLSTTDYKDVVFAGTKPYYPLGDRPILLFGHSGKLTDNSHMKVVAGNTATYDAVLSNYGKRTSAPGPDGPEIVTGTLGSADDPAEYMIFRHVMTKLTVKVVVDTSQSPAVDPVPKTVQFQLPGVYNQGTFPIRATWPDIDPALATGATHSGNTLYTIRLGDNYLIPDKTNLTGKQFSYLKIDDYDGKDDLSRFRITPDGADPNKEMLLLPGYAYVLTLKIRKLQVEGVELTKVDWTPEVITPEVPDYEPQVLTLVTNGGYTNSDEHRITKVVLRTADRQYVGAVDGTGTDIEYITLPASGVTSVDLYTDRGLLLTAASSEFTYSAGTLTMNNMSAGGMSTLNGGAASADNPYLVTTAVQFVNIKDDMTASTGHYRLMADVDFNDLYDSSFNGFADPFGGTVNGNGYVLKNLNLTGLGLFVTNNGTIERMRLHTGALTHAGNQVVGSLCSINNGIIVASVNELPIDSGTGIAGGICGENHGTIIGCLNTGNVVGRIIGGMSGHNYNTAENAIVACVNTGMLKLDNTPTRVGAVVAVSEDAPGVTVVNTCFWLTGTAQKYVGIEGTAVDEGEVVVEDSSPQSPRDLRATSPVNPGEPTIIERLNAVLATVPTWGTLYEYEIAYAATGVTWPFPAPIQ